MSPSVAAATNVAVTASNALVRVLLAPECVACGEPLDRPLDGPACDRCWRAITRLTAPCCARCGDALPGFASGDSLCARCRRHVPLLGIARSAGRYDGSLRHIIHAFKYERRRALAGPLGRLMREAGHDVLDGADALVPVPLSWRRALHRGFNQADDLARHLGLPVWPVLRRTRHGPPQAGLPAAARHANVRGAYAIRQWRCLGSALQGRVLVLVDDVMTTGATLDACAEVLVSAGAGAVRALTVARAVTGPSDGSRPARHPSTAHRR
jgi:ComF family protein